MDQTKQERDAFVPTATEDSATQPNPESGHTEKKKKTEYSNSNVKLSFRGQNYHTLITSDIHYQPKKRTKEMHNQDWTNLG